MNNNNNLKNPTSLWVCDLQMMECGKMFLSRDLWVESLLPIQGPQHLEPKFSTSKAGSILLMANCTACLFPRYWKYFFDDVKSVLLWLIKLSVSLWFSKYFFRSGEIWQTSYVSSVCVLYLGWGSLRWSLAGLRGTLGLGACHGPLLGGRVLTGLLSDQLLQRRCNHLSFICVSHWTLCLIHCVSLIAGAE